MDPLGGFKIRVQERNPPPAKAPSGPTFRPVTAAQKAGPPAPTLAEFNLATSGSLGKPTAAQVAARHKTALYQQHLAGLHAPKVDPVTQWSPQEQQRARALRQQNEGTAGVIVRSGLEGIAEPAKHLANALGGTGGSRLAELGAAAGTAALSVIPPIRGPRALLAAIDAARAGEDALTAGKAAYRARSLVLNDLTQQLPKARSRVTRGVEKTADTVSQAMMGQGKVAASARKVLPTASAQARVAKAAGRENMVDAGRQQARMAGELKVLPREGTPEDVAHFWWAQLPVSHRNVQGLQLVRAQQAKTLEAIASGHTLKALQGRLGALQAEARGADAATVFKVLPQIEDVKKLITDLPHQANDLGVSLAELDRVIAHPPKLNPRIIGAVHAISDDRRMILEGAKVLKPERATARQGLVSKWLGLNARPEPYVGNGVEGVGSVPDLARQSGYLYHRTSLDRFETIREKGLAPAKPTGNPPGVYFGNEPLQARGLAQKRANSVYLRVSKSRVSGLSERAFGESVTSQAVPAADLEYLAADGKWHALAPTTATGTDAPAFIGHRLSGKVRGSQPSLLPAAAGVGRPKLPQGVGSENKLVLANTGRIRPSTRVAAEDWQAAQVYRQANTARSDLAKMGTPFTGRLPDGYALVNPRGRAVPAHWKTDMLAKLGEQGPSQDEIAQAAHEIVSGFISDPKTTAALKQGGDEAAQALRDFVGGTGVKWDELRVVPERVVRRYYGQFTAARGSTLAGKAYDSAVDFTAASIIFARLGYVPKNIAQNLVMAAPHQGVFFAANVPRAAQALLDPELRHLIVNEVGMSGATQALGAEARFAGKLRGAPGKAAGAVGAVADTPIRVSAWIHEAAAAGVIPKLSPFLSDHDKQALLYLLTDPSQRPLLNDIRSRAVEAMADFSRLTPMQRRWARRFLVIPGWLWAGSRYPFHFAVTHPGRTAALAYAAAGEPGAPSRYQVNKPVDEYFAKDLPSFIQGIETAGGNVLRTSSLSPVGTPWEIFGALVGGSPRTAYDYANPVPSALQGIASRTVQGPNGPYRTNYQDAVLKNLERLVPTEKFIRDVVSPPANPKTYPGDTSRWGRIERELGVIPIRINRTGGGKSAVRPIRFRPTGSSGGGGFSQRSKTHSSGGGFSQQVHGRGAGGGFSGR